MYAIKADCLSKALFLSRLERREEAIEAILLSLANFPWNWSAWCLLSSCINDGDEVGTIHERYQ
jgi:anaphase-promoting complex subunit 8